MCQEVGVVARTIGCTCSVWGIILDEMGQSCAIVILSRTVPNGQAWGSRLACDSSSTSGSRREGRPYPQQTEEHS